MARKRKVAPSGVALVIGTAEGVWQEVAAAQAVARINHVIVINDMIPHWPVRVDAAVSLHPEKMPKWLDDRAALGFDAPSKLICHSGWQAWFKQIGIPEELPLPFDLVTAERFEGQADSGSSGLFAVKVALEDIGATKVICCGIPMIMEAGHFVNRSYQPWYSAIRFRAAWEQAMPHLQGRVRSMSGWTAQMLGKPDKQWLAS